MKTISKTMPKQRTPKSTNVPFDKTVNHRDWCVTVNGPVETLVPQATGVVLERVRYLVYQHEICPKTGREHLQLFLQMPNSCKFGGIKKLFPKAHIEPRYALTPDAARDYCMREFNEDGTPKRKPGTVPFEFGEYTGGQGCRNDIHRVTNMVVAGEKLRTVALAAPVQWVKYNRGFKDLHVQVHDRVREWTTELYVYYGSPGTGKSTKAFAEAGKDAYYMPVSNGSVWFDGYAGHDIVVWDDFDYKTITRALFCQLVNHGQLTVPIKGGFVSWSPRRVYLTTNIAPDLWWPEQIEHRHSWMRRITHQEWFSAPFEQ